MRALLLALAACHAEPIASCTDDLAGTYHSDGETWNVLDNRNTLEAYPMFDDTKQTVAGLEIAPRVIDLHRIDDVLAGDVTRRYMKGSQRCDSKATAKIVACHDNTLDIVLADPLPPIGFAPCAYGEKPSSRRERWVRATSPR